MLHDFPKSAVAAFTRIWRKARGLLAWQPFTQCKFVKLVSGHFLVFHVAQLTCSKRLPCLFLSGCVWIHGSGEENGK